MNRRPQGRRRRFWQSLFLVMAGLVPIAGYGAGQPGLMDFLVQVQKAARTLDYSGIAVYQQGRALQASELVHWLDGGGEHERFEALDGQPRECLRDAHGERCLFPDQRLVVMRPTGSDHFPALLLGDPAPVVRHYEWRRVPGVYRVAGRQCQVSELRSRDTLRYSLRLCTDVDTHLLLRTQTINPQGHLIDQLAFSQLNLGSQVSPDVMAPRHDIEGWEVRRETSQPVDLAALGWRFVLPPGFQTQAEMSYPVSPVHRVHHMVVSDGLAAISIFIETFDPQRDQSIQEGNLQQGAINIHRTRVASYWLTVMGEVPAETVTTLAQSVEYIPKAVH